MKRACAEKGGFTDPRISKFPAILALGLLLSISLIVPRATASIYTLAPGNTITASSSAFPAGGSVLDSITAPFSASTINGTVTSTVITGDISNPYGGLTFEYLLTLAGGTDNSSEMTVGGFAGLQTDVSYGTNAPGRIAPSFFSRSSAGVNNGDTLELSWLLNKLSPGQTGDLVIVQTSAHTFGFGQGGVIDSQAANVEILAPVPEPQIASLAVMGLGALFIFVRRNPK